MNTTSKFGDEDRKTRYACE